MWYFEFCKDGNGKTEAATRVVPIHRVLIEVGLLQYRDALPADSGLFPSLKGRKSKDGKRGPMLGQAFESWRKNLGINRKGVNFHSFRHCVGDRLRKAGVAEDDRAALLGHKDELWSRWSGPEATCGYCRGDRVSGLEAPYGDLIGSPQERFSGSQRPGCNSQNC